LAATLRITELTVPPIAFGQFGLVDLFLLLAPVLVVLNALVFALLGFVGWMLA
jgi:hypothetical protein